MMRYANEGKSNSNKKGDLSAFKLENLKTGLKKSYGRCSAYSVREVGEGIGIRASSGSGYAALKNASMSGKILKPAIPSESACVLFA